MGKLPLIDIIPDLPDWFDKVNPFKLLSQYVEDAYRSLVVQYQQLALDPPRPDASSALIYVGGEILGLASFVAYTSTMVLIGLYMIRRSVINRLLDMVVFGIAVTVAWPIWFILNDGATSIGDSLSEKALFYESSGGKDTWLSLALGSDNPLITLGGFGSTGTLGLGLVSVVVGYEIFNIVTKYCGIGLLVLWPLNDKFQAWGQALIGTLVVTRIFGRPVMLFFLEVSELLADQVFTGSFSLVLLTCLGFILGIGAQFFMIRAGYRQTVKITGGSGSFTQRIKGSVTTKQDKGSTISTANVTAARVESRQGMLADTRKVFATQAKNRGSQKLMDAAGRAMTGATLAGPTGAAMGAASAVSSQAVQRHLPSSTTPDSRGVEGVVDSTVEVDRNIPPTVEPVSQQDQDLPPTHTRL